MREALRSDISRLEFLRQSRQRTRQFYPEFSYQIDSLEPVVRTKISFEHNFVFTCPDLYRIHVKTAVHPIEIALFAQRSAVDKTIELSALFGKIYLLRYDFRFEGKCQLKATQFFLRLSAAVFFDKPGLKHCASAQSCASFPTDNTIDQQYVLLLTAVHTNAVRFPYRAIERQNVRLGQTVVEFLG